MSYGRVMVCVSLLALGGCGDTGRAPTQGSGAAGVSRDDAAMPPAARPGVVDTTPVPSALVRAEARSCAAELGTGAAARRVEVCRAVSPATHPPCNAANSCAMIEDEIARSCALFAGDGTPMQGCRSDARGMQAAADVVRRYYSAIDARDYATAWRQWGDDGRPGQTFAAFEQGYAQTRSVRVTIGALAPGDGGAGSIYQPVPVTIEAVLEDGRRQRFTGEYIVRRVNGVDGAAAWQLRWHLDTARMRVARK